MALKNYIKTVIQLKMQLIKFKIIILYTNIMYKTIYYTSRDFDGTTLVQALPQSVTSMVIEEWTDIETKEVSNRLGPKKMIKYPVHHVVLLVDKNAMTAIRDNYVRRFDVHHNLFPRVFEQPNKFYVRLTAEEKPVFNRVLKAFCKAVRISEPLIDDDERGFSFVEFATSDFLPQLLGLLRGYPELENSVIVYAKTRK
jgi:hypothetical protein